MDSPKPQKPNEPDIVTGFVYPLPDGTMKEAEPTPYHQIINNNPVTVCPGFEKMARAAIAAKGNNKNPLKDDSCNALKESDLESDGSEFLTFTEPFLFTVSPIRGINTFTLCLT